MNKYEKECEDFIYRSYNEFVCLPDRFNGKLSEEFLRNHADRLCFIEICKNQKISEKFIEDYIDDIILKHIPFCYMENMSDKYSWGTFL